MRTPAPAVGVPAQPAPDRPAARARGRRARRAAVALLAAAVLAGCGVRLDSAPPEEPAPDAVEELRQEAAVDAATIAATVAEITSEDEATAALLERVAADAGAHLGALGGVWVAWPEGAPEDVETSDVVTTPPVPEPGAADLLTLLADGAAEARSGALQAPTDELAALLASVAVSRSRSATALAAVLGTEPPAGTAAPLDPQGLLARGVDGPTLLVLDQARYAFETVAARTEGAARERATTRAIQLRSLVDAAVAAGAPDVRLGFYDLPGPDAAAGLSAEQAAAVDAEERLLEHWLFSLGVAAPDARAALLDAAAHAAAEVEAWGGTLRALPGLAAA
ncbi:DUF4439 domain-containing protein [Georgenia subflava]|uniref:DUF4439 domain-containing protein n=1 Tax=Georgenia subflava TaxID=1622177 RepID=UPI001264F39B|nr:DUF4439 domain-containing protein [Georgenia subflava]